MESKFEKVMKYIEIIFVCIFFFTLAVFVIYGIILENISKNKCIKSCDEKEIKFSGMIKNGKMNINDLCVCYDNKNKYEVFIIK